MQLIPIQAGGALPDFAQPPLEAAGFLEATVALYGRVGFTLPWICYIALRDDRPVGTCGFTSAPRDGRVEMAYFTFPAFEGQGVATQMAEELILLASRTDPSVTVFARTLLERNASHRILEKLGFVCMGEVEVPEDGTVLEWQKASGHIA
jgi:ribosomal-protein-alanine N-acetyltransferase